MMHMNWSVIFSCAWPIFWITTVYSYIVCGIVGTITGIRTKHNKTKIDEAIEKFIISPLYVATFFSLFSILFYKHAKSLMLLIDHAFFFSTLALGITVFIAHFLVELLEATFIRKNPLRMLDDRDAIILSGIYLILIVSTSVMVVFSK